MGKGLGIAALPHAEAQMKKRINRVPHAERRRAAADLWRFAHSAGPESKADKCCLSSLELLVALAFVAASDFHGFD